MRTCKKNEKPLVSVIMPCYNHEKYVRDSIESVLYQTYENIEFVVLDNGSNDRSYEIIKEYSGSIDKILHFDKNDVMEAGRELERQCKGDYLAYLASDDIWEKDKIEKQMQKMLENPEIKACFTWVELIDDNSNPIDEADNIFRVANRNRYEWINTLLSEGNCLCCTSSLIKMDILTLVRQKRKAFWQLGDLKEWLEIVLHYDIYIVEEALTKYRWHPVGKNGNMSMPSRDSIIRTGNETQVIVDQIIEEIDNETFTKAFGNKFRNPKASTDNEILCEKFFWLLRKSEEKSFLQTNVINFYYRHNINNDEKGGYILSKTLDECYGYGIADFQKYCANSGVGCIEVERLEMEQARLEIVDLQHRVASLQEIVNLDVSKEERIVILRKRIFNDLPKEKKDLLKLQEEYLRKILGYVEKQKGDMGILTRTKLIEGAKENIDVLKIIWDDFLYLDTDIEVSQWERYKELIQEKSISLGEFYEELVPIWFSFYTVLGQYVE